ncbi:hypothetical protein J0K78_17010 [Halobacillus sp. GSS1]|uniref:phage tail protein n=1 Tax=Halobacillus sp. GSS1 TaxID=2815919 RepID=UPI001A8CCD7C|nr:hypothetical protein [Halobacillus sp. GSS1]MBN9655978.1 hypothetical protein [Halobacillus sp. GSS1]
MASKRNIQYRVSVVDRFTKPLRRMQSQLESFKRTVESVDNKVINPKVDVQTAKATADLENVKRKAKSIPNLIYVHVVSNVDKFNQDIDSVADKIRNFSTVYKSAFSGGLMAGTPIAANALGVLAGGIGSLLPVLGTLGGGFMGLASSMGAAAAGAGLLAPFIGTLGADLFKLDENVDKTSAKFRGFSQETQNALTALDGMQGAFGKLKYEIRDPIYQGMAGFFNAAEQAIGLARPAIHSTADAFSRMGEAMKNSMGDADVKSFFSWLTTAAPRAFENWSRIIGNTTVGLLNLLRAFSPLAITMEAGLLRMSSAFREWADSLSASDKFRRFIDYVKENGGKLLSIVGNIVMGLVGMGTAFAPLSAEMLTGFEKMTQKFRTWGETLSQNEGFKSFVEFVRTNTPQIMTLIGELVTIAINLGKGFAWVGEIMTPLVSKFLGFMNTLMEGNPIIARLVAILPVLIGGLKMLVPAFILVTNVVNTIWPAISMLFGWIGKLGGAFIRMLPIISRAGTFLLTFSNPVGIIISIVALLATVIIANWDKIWAWTKKTFSAAKTFMTSAWAVMKAKTIEAAVAIYTWAYRKFSEMKTAVTDKMSQIKSQVQQKFQQAKDQARSIIVNMVSAVKSKFVEMKIAVQNKMIEVKNKIIELWNRAKEFLSNIDLVQIGKDIIQGLINGITSMGGAVWEAAKGIAKKAKDAITGFMDSHSPSRVMIGVGNDVGSGLVIGISNMESPAARAATRLAEAVNKPLQGIKKSAQKAFKFSGNSALGKYLNVMIGDDPDYMNDWLTHMPKSMRNQAKNLGKQIAEARANGSFSFGNNRANEQQEASGGRYTVEVPVYLDSRQIAKATAADITKYQKLNAQKARGAI